MIDSPQVSIIIPTYNHRDLVSFAVESALAQTYKNREVIVIDDGSTDGTGELLAERFGDDIVYEYQPNKGRGAARNKGVTLARGEYVQFLDADDRLAPEKLQVHVDVLENHPEMAAAYGHCLVFPEDDFGNFEDWHGKDHYCSGDVLFEEIHDPFLLPLMVLVRKNWVLRAGGFDETLRSNEDWDLWLRIAAVGGRFEYVEGKPIGYFLKRLYNRPEAARVHLNSGVIVLSNLKRTIGDPAIDKLLQIDRAIGEWLFSDGKAAADLGSRWRGISRMSRSLLMSSSRLDYKLAALLTSALFDPRRANLILDRLLTLKRGAGRPRRSRTRLAIVSHAYGQEENRAVWKRFSQDHPDWDVTVIVPEKWSTDRYGATAEYVSTSNKEANFSVAPIPLSRGRRSFFRSPDMGFRRLSPDIIYIAQERHDWSTLQSIIYGRLWARRAKIIGGSTINIDYELTRPQHVLKENIFLRGTDAIVAMNHEAAQVLRHHGYERPILVQHGIGADGNTWFPIEESRGNAGPLAIGFVGALVEEKGVLDLARALLKMGSEWSLTLVGDGPLRTHMTEVLQGRGPGRQVSFFGTVPRSAIPEIMRSLDVLVLPSRTTPTWKEQFGLVLAEAMLSGVAVAGSDSGAIPEVIGTAGIVFPEGDTSALAGALDLLARDPEALRRFKASGRERAESCFSTAALSDQFYSFCSTLLD